VSTAPAMHTLPVWIMSLSTESLWDNKLIRYRTYQIPNLSYAEPIRYQTYLIPNHLVSNQSETEPIWYQTNLIPNQSDTKPIWYRTNLMGLSLLWPPLFHPFVSPPSFFPSTYAPLLLLSHSTSPLCLSPLYF
jgi:hypothetical protein